MLRVVALGILVVALAGCGGDDEALPTEPVQARAYFLLDDRVWPVARALAEEGDAADEIVAALVQGPTTDEIDLGLTSSFPDGVDVDVADGVATVESETELTTEQLAQLVYSLTQLDPVVQSVDVDGRAYTRADFEEQTPSVLVESPLAFEEVASPITATGTANTFEATFHYEVVDSEGEVVDENFVTATSGSGTRGTFEFTTGDVDDIAGLVVFERSAEDGSRIREVEIPLTSAP